MMKSVLFIHRSVGRNLITDGNVYQLAGQASPNFSFSDYDQNIDSLHSGTGMPRIMNFRFPGNDTKPADYATLFSDAVDTAYRPILDFALGYDIIIIKSCYPNSDINSDEQLEAIKGNYLSITRFFATHPDKQLIILTSPPLRRLRTNPAAAKRARQLATWLVTQNFGANTGVFNFYDLLANPEAAKHPNVLYADYCRWLPFDSHPNAKASQIIAPLLVDFIAQRIR